ncbi:MAG TPA: hypothetical protein VFB27_13895 [Opitutaceae bacterium]|nr:hypothetical protein [Opitutaceae bacterium]
MVFAVLMAPRPGRACACGCGVFDVGTRSMLPSGSGGMAFLEYDYQDQNRNWSGSSRAPADNNNDKDIRTSFFTAGLQYMFNRKWGLQLGVPYDRRHFETAGDDGNLVSLNWGALGDIRLQGVYTGFSPDMSTGVTFGLKLPTGDYTHARDFVDRDTEIGTGSTDLLLGGFHRDSLTSDGSWDWFAQAELDLPVLIRDQYRPGLEVDAAAGAYYNRASIGGVKVAPIGQIVVSERTRDSGAHSADPVASGYQRVLLSPGVEFDFHPFSLYADLEFPVFQHFTGNQLAAPVLCKVIASYMF